MRKKKRRKKNIGIERNRGKVIGEDMRKSKSRIWRKKEVENRIEENIGKKDKKGIEEGKVEEMKKIDNNNREGWSEGKERSLKIEGEKIEKIDEVEEVKVILRRDGMDKEEWINVKRKRKMKKNEMNGGVVIEELDKVEKILLGRSLRKVVMKGMKEELIGIEDFRGKIEMNWRVLKENKKGNKGKEEGRWKKFLGLGFKSGKKIIGEIIEIDKLGNSDR